MKKIGLIALVAMACSGTAMAQSEAGAELSLKSEIGGLSFSQNSGNFARLSGPMMGLTASMSDWKNGVGDNAYFTAYSLNKASTVKYSGAVKTVDDGSYTSYKIGYLRSLDNIFLASIGMGLSAQTSDLAIKATTSESVEKIKTDAVFVDFAMFTRKQQLPGAYWNATVSFPVWNKQEKSDFSGKIAMQPTAKLLVGHMFDNHVFVELSYEREGFKQEADLSVTSSGKTTTVYMPRTLTRKSMLSVGYLF